MAEFKAEHLREYASRDWIARAHQKPLGIEILAPTEALALSEMLWQHMRSIDPKWPDADQRRLDLEHHQRLARLKLRLANALVSH
ncbi:MAG: hypothetical protein AB1Z98_32505 [Nannocystaceae bacterium]